MYQGFDYVESRLPSMRGGGGDALHERDVRFGYHIGLAGPSGHPLSGQADIRPDSDERGQRHPRRRTGRPSSGAPPPPAPRRRPTEGPVAGRLPRRLRRVGHSSAPPPPRPMATTSMPTTANPATARMPTSKPPRRAGRPSKPKPTPRGPTVQAHDAQADIEAI